MCYYMDTGLVLFQAEDGIRALVRSRGLGYVYKRQLQGCHEVGGRQAAVGAEAGVARAKLLQRVELHRRELRPDIGAALSLIHI